MRRVFLGTCALILILAPVFLYLVRSLFVHSFGFPIFYYVLCFVKYDKTLTFRITKYNPIFFKLFKYLLLIIKNKRIKKK